MRRNIYIVFGEMGAGKNHVGMRLARHLGCRFYDGDDALPWLLKKKVERFESLTLRDIEVFVSDYLTPRILLKANHSDVVVAQALYRQKHRDLLDQLLVRDHNVFWIHLKTPSNWTHARRLLGRPNGWRWFLLGMLSKPYFEVTRPYRTMVSRDGMDVGKAWEEMW